MHVYERVREYIEEQGLTESDVAEAAGIPNVTFSACLLYTSSAHAVPAHGLRRRRGEVGL